MLWKRKKIVEPTPAEQMIVSLTRQVGELEKKLAASEVAPEPRLADVPTSERISTVMQSALVVLEEEVPGHNWIIIDAGPEEWWMVHTRTFPLPSVLRLLLMATIATTGRIFGGG